MEGESSDIAPPETAPAPSVSQASDSYELKFLLTIEEAASVETWARRRMTPDPYGEEGVYRTTTLYLDTPFFDVFHKSPGHRRSKYRVRRYGTGEVIYLERKKRRGDRVRKHREVLPLAHLTCLFAPEGPITWFGPRVRERVLNPVCCIGYTRTAFAGDTSASAMRLTLDREVVGTPAESWTLPERVDGRPLLPDDVILELKFRDTLPGLFRTLLESLPTRPAGGSKYARCVKAWQLAPMGK